MSFRPTILLDMDGVLCEFVGHAAPLFGLSYDELIAKAEPGKYWIFEETLGIKYTDFWEIADKAGEKFWHGIPECPWARELYAYCQSVGDVYISTAPAPSDHCSTAKNRWLKNFTGDPMFDRSMVGKHKQLMAKPGVILIDDCEENCVAFRKAGGAALTFPRFWNYLHPFEHRNLAFVKERMPDMLKLSEEALNRLPSIQSETHQ